jgi:hypothetical protein
LADEQRPRFRQYVAQQRRPSHRHTEQVRVGTVLPSSGVTYGVRDYRYTIVNDRPVLVDPRRIA